MQWNHDQLYQALVSRDQRFDGHFFTGVTSTGIYCRAICPAVKPKRENVQFYTSATAAEREGFRPCLRCRPDTIGKASDNNDIDQLLRLIEDQLVHAVDVTNLATAANKSSRSIERLFTEHLSCSPAEYIRTRRLHLSRKLLRETTAPVTNIAFASGFSSLRAFNDAFKKQYNHTPSDFRQQAKDASTALTVPYGEGYSWDDLIGFLEARAITGVECVKRNGKHSSYQRFLQIGADQGVVSIDNDTSKNQLRVSIPDSLFTHSHDILTRVRQVFDTDFSPSGLDHLNNDPLLADVFKTYQHVRVPGTWNRFELIIRAILGQFVSVAAARRLCERLVDHYAPLDESNDQPHRQFPSPAQLVGEDLMQIGTTRKRSEYITGIAKKIVDGDLVLDELHGLDGEKQLLKLYGVGPWTASYISMRALKYPDAFPAGDLVLRKAVAQLQSGQHKELPSQKEMENISQAWRPWRAYAALMLWRYWSSLEAEGTVK